MAQPLRTGPNCGPDCPCDADYPVAYRCVSFTNAENTERCGYVVGPFPGRMTYQPQGKGHHWDPDDFTAFTAATRADHGSHGEGSDRNYWVPDGHDFGRPSQS